LVKDAIQDLFLTLWKLNNSVNQPNSVKGYLFISLRRSLFQELQKIQNRYERNKQYLDDAFSVDFTIEEVIFKDEIDQQRKVKLVAAINELGGKQKETLFLRYYHGLTNAETAEVMGINEQSVKNNLSRAVNNLRNVLGNMSLPAIGLMLHQLFANSNL
jgi:RNA polymerase sigma factor (sigma-70 family)